MTPPESPISPARIREAFGKMWLTIAGIAVVVIVVSGALTSVFRDVQNASDLATEAASSSAVIAAQNTQIAKDIVEAQRSQCERVNDLRENQASGIAFQIKQTDATLKAGLGPALEPFRAQIIRQNDARRDQLKKLRRRPGEFPVKGKPFTTDCARAHPDAAP